MLVNVAIVDIAIVIVFTMKISVYSTQHTE